MPYEVWCWSVDAFLVVLKRFSWPARQQGMQERCFAKLGEVCRLLVWGKTICHFPFQNSNSSSAHKHHHREIYYQGWPATKYEKRVTSWWAVRTETDWNIKYTTRGNDGALRCNDGAIQGNDWLTPAQRFCPPPHRLAQTHTLSPPRCATIASI